MTKKQIELSKEEVLLRARAENLSHAKGLTAMNAHGKILGMDAFSWENPPMQSLVKVIESFPFSVVWLASMNQIQEGLDLSIGLHEKLNTIVIYDRGNLPKDSSLVMNINNVLCVGSVDAALDYLKAFEKEKMVFLFTTEGDESIENLEIFDSWITNMK